MVIRQVWIFTQGEYAREIQIALGLGDVTAWRLADFSDLPPERRGCLRLDGPAADRRSRSGGQTERISTKILVKEERAQTSFVDSVCIENLPSSVDEKPGIAKDGFRIELCACAPVKNFDPTLFTLGQGQFLRPAPSVGQFDDPTLWIAHRAVVVIKKVESEVPSSNSIHEFDV